MFEKLARIIAETINVDPSDIYPEMTIQGNDGLNEWEFARVIIASEREFGIRIYDIDAAGFRTAGDLLSYIKQNKKEKEKEKDEDSPIEIDEYFFSE